MSPTAVTKNYTCNRCHKDIKFLNVRASPHEMSKKNITWLVNQAVTRTAALLNVMFTESRIRGKRHKYHKKYCTGNKRKQ